MVYLLIEFLEVKFGVMAKNFIMLNQVINNISLFKFKMLSYSSPLLLTYQKKYKGNSRTKARWALAEKHIAEDLYTLQHWRDYKELESKKSQKEQLYLKPKETISIKKDLISKIARYHYFIQFCIALIVGLIYIINFGFTITNLILFIPFISYIAITTLVFITQLICSLRIQTHIENLDLSTFNTSKVTSISDMLTGVVKSCLIKISSLYTLDNLANFSNVTMV